MIGNFEKQYLTYCLVNPLLKGKLKERRGITPSSSRQTLMHDINYLQVKYQIGKQKFISGHANQMSLRIFQTNRRSLLEHVKALIKKKEGKKGQIRKE